MVGNPLALRCPCPLLRRGSLKSWWKPESPSMCTPSIPVQSTGVSYSWESLLCTQIFWMSARVMPGVLPACAAAVKFACFLKTFFIGLFYLNFGIVPKLTIDQRFVRIRIAFGRKTVKKPCNLSACSNTAFETNSAFLVGFIPDGRNSTTPAVISFC